MKFLITSTPRSGTGYTAQYLRRLGIRAGHESFINPSSIKKWRREGGKSFPLEIDIGLEGEVSWLAAAPEILPEFRRRFPEIVIVHLVRNPCASLSSLIGTDHIRDGGFYADHLLERHGEHKKLPRHCIDSPSYAEQIYLRWHKRISQHADYFVRVEDLAIHSVCIELLNTLNLPEKIPNEKAFKKKIGSLSRQFNTREGRATYENLFDLSLASEALIEFIRSYNYCSCGSGKLLHKQPDIEEENPK